MQLLFACGTSRDQHRSNSHDLAVKNQELEARIRLLTVKEEQSQPVDLDSDTEEYLAKSQPIKSKQIKFQPI